MTRCAECNALRRDAHIRGLRVVRGHEAREVDKALGAGVLACMEIDGHSGLRSVACVKKRTDMAIVTASVQRLPMAHWTLYAWPEK